MQFKTWLGLSLATLCAAFPPDLLEARDVATLPPIKSALSAGASLFGEVDKAVLALTADNAKTQLATVNTAFQKLSTDTQANLKKIASSGPITLGEITGLLSEKPRNELINPILALFNGINSTVTHIVAKKDIIKGSGAADTLAAGLKAQTQALLDIIAVVPGQVPTSVKGIVDGLVSSIIPAAPGAAAPAPAAPAGKGAKGAKAGAAKGPGVDILSSQEFLQGIRVTLDGVWDQVITFLKS